MSIIDSKKCSKCLMVKPLEDFYPRPAVRLGRQSQCKECSRKRLRAEPRALRRREKAIAFAALKGNRPCVDCGGRFPNECMEFDHVRGTKRANVGGLYASSSTVLLREIEKCDLVCANCHRIRTFARRRAQVA
jgi:hypothetical protein